MVSDKTICYHTITSRAQISESVVVRKKNHTSKRALCPRKERMNECECKVNEISESFSKPLGLFDVCHIKKVVVGVLLHQVFCFVYFDTSNNT